MKKLILSLVLFILSCNMVFAGANIIDNVTTEDVYASGSVGVGTTTPSDKLNIVDGTSDIRLGATSAGYGGLWLSTQSTLQWKLETQTEIFILVHKQEVIFI